MNYLALAATHLERSTTCELRDRDHNLAMAEAYTNLAKASASPASAIERTTWKLAAASHRKAVDLESYWRLPDEVKQALGMLGLLVDAHASEGDEDGVGEATSRSKAVIA